MTNLEIFLIVFSSALVGIIIGLCLYYDMKICDIEIMHLTKRSELMDQHIELLDLVKQMENEKMENELKKTIVSLYKPPFKYQYGYIFDSEGNMVTDDLVKDENQVARVRGWGRLSYMDNPEQLQDGVGEMIADILTKHWGKDED